MKSKLIKLANYLDSMGLHAEADEVDSLIKQSGFMDSVKGFFGMDDSEKEEIPDEEEMEEISDVDVEEMLKSKTKLIEGLYPEDDPIRSTEKAALDDFGRQLLNEYRRLGLDKRKDQEALRKLQRLGDTLAHTHLLATPADSRRARFFGISHQIQDAKDAGFPEKGLMATISRREGKRDKAFEHIANIYLGFGLEIPMDLQDAFIPGAKP